MLKEAFVIKVRRFNVMPRTTKEENLFQTVMSYK